MVLKKLLTITLLIVHLFNLAGYSFLFRYLNARSSEQLMNHIDNDRYEEEDLVEIKVPLNMPYQLMSIDNERYDGEIEINGLHHRYVKRKVSSDTLYLLCIANTKSDKLKKAETAFSSKANDFDSRNNKNETAKKAGALSEFRQDFSEYHLISPDKSVHSWAPLRSVGLTEIFTSPQGKPPKINS